MKKQFLILFAFISVLALSQVPQRFNKVIVTGDITSPKFIKTGSTADSVLLGNGSARAISAIKTDTVSLSNRINAKATGNGTANGTNTGDETLTSIKTKLGAATSVSDGYLKYQDWSIFNSKEPAITKNSGFNLPLGNTPGTILEGRTFGTAAASAVGDFIQNQNSSAQPATIWINGSIRSPKLEVTTGLNNKPYIKSAFDDSYFVGLEFHTYNGGTNDITALTISPNGVASFSNTVYGQTLQSAGAGIIGSTLSVTGTATFSSTVNSKGFLLNGNNLTSSLTTNCIPKWNGSNFVNATAGTDYQLPITITTNGTSGAATFENGVMNVPNYDVSGGVNQTQTTVNGSTSGNMVCSMPFRTGSYKKVLIALNGLNGSATYTFPSSFSRIPDAVGRGTSGIGISAQSATSITITSTGSTGWIIIEGY